MFEIPSFHVFHRAVNILRCATVGMAEELKAQKADLDAIKEHRKHPTTNASVDISDKIAETSTHEPDGEGSLGFQGNDDEEYVKGHPVIRNGY